jgi:peroxiredoxin
VTVPHVGSTAPNFATKNQFGQDITLSGLRGAPVVIVFYPFAFTRICTSELAELRDSRAAFDESGVRVLAVSTDTMFTLRVFAEQERLGFDLLTDHWPHGQIASSYGVFDDDLGCALRGTFVLDAHGTIVWSVINSIGAPRTVSSVLAALPSA